MFLLFVLSALVPLAGMGVVSYRNVSGHIEDLAERRVTETAKAAGMALIERLSAADAQLLNRIRLGSEHEERFLERVEELAVDGGSGLAVDSEEWDRLRAGEPLLLIAASQSTELTLQLLRLAPSGGSLFRATLRTDSIVASSRIYAQTSYGAGICVISETGLRTQCDNALETGFQRGSLPTALQRRGSLQWQTADGDFIAGYWTAFLRPAFGSPSLTVVVAESAEGLRVPAQAFSSAFLLAMALCLLVVLVSSTVVIRRSLAPLEKLKNAVAQVGESHFGSRVDIKSGDEFEDLGSAFNDMSSRIQTQLSELDDLYVGTIRALARAIDASSPWTRGHSERVARLSSEIGSRMGLGADELELIYRGGLLHDVGKIGVSPGVLDKPGRLTDDEFEQIRSHPVIGVNILEPVEQLAAVLPMVRSHHERIDGTGYPDRLVGDEIHPYARIMAVADVWDAITSERPYRSAMSFEEAWGVVSGGAGTHFEPAVVTAFEGIARDWYRRPVDASSEVNVLGAAVATAW